MMQHLKTDGTMNFNCTRYFLKVIHIQIFCMRQQNMQHMPKIKTKFCIIFFNFALLKPKDRVGAAEALIFFD
jgi:hypothetical protein